MTAFTLASAQAATTIDVTTTNVVEAVDGACSLREALRAARTNTTVNECSAAGGPPFTINLQANAVYNATTIGNSDFQLGDSAFMINSQTVTINGNGSTLTQTGQQQRILEVSGGNLTLRNLTVAFGAATGSAAALSGWGGGVLVAFGGTVLSLEDVTLTGNVASMDGSALYASNSPVINIHRSTVANNTTSSTLGSQIRMSFSSQLNMANSTLVGPSRGLILNDSSSARATHLTITTTPFTSLILAGNSSLTLQNSIVDGGCGVDAGSTGNFTNIASNSGTCFPVGGLPQLGVLASNGGPTQTRILVLPSGVRDAVPSCAYLSAGTNPLFSDGAVITTDQRGFARNRCDLGAVESMTISPASLPGGTFGVPFSATISQTGGGAPATFATTSGTLPPGLSINAGTGAISGTPTAAGSYSFTLTVTDSGGFKSDANYTMTIARANQTLTLAAQTTASRLFVAGGTFAIDPLATASSGLTPAYSSDSTSVCTVSGTTVTMVSAGTCTIRASQGGNGNYNAAPSVTQSITINPGVQTLTFNAQTTASQTFVAGGTFAINPVATTNAGAPAVEHASLTPAVCTVSGTTVTMVSAGTCTLRASHVGNSNYQPAVSVTQNVTINPGVQLISFSAPTPRTLGDLPFTVTAGGGASGNPVTFTSLTSTVCTATGINGSLITLLRAGTCTLRAAQAGNANYAAATPVERSFMVGSGTSSVALDSSTNPASYRTPVTLTARVGGAVPGGVVRFLNGTATLCEAAVSNGVATCTVSDLLEGAHSLRAYYLGDANNQPSFSTEFVQIVPKVGIHQGAWWGGPQESGWGLSIMEQGNTLVAAWYFFDSAGKPTWLILPGCAWNANKTACTGPLQRAAGSWFGNYRADDVRLTQVGSATFTFSDAGNGRFDYSVDGTGGSKVISRMDLGGNPSAPFDFTSVWWGGQSQNGWGLSLFAAGPTLAGVWYTYDTQGQPTWMLFNGGSWQNPSRYRSGLFRATGSPMIGATYDASRLSVQPVGELYFEFADFNTAEMTYLVDGLLQFKNITKQKF